MTILEDFTPYTSLADELIDKTIKEQLADVARLLAFDLAY
jgi:hypothetical protein